MFSSKELAEATGGIVKSGALSQRFSGLSIDTRTIKPDEIFVAIVGKNFDGHDFIIEAIGQGAKGIVYADAQKVQVFQKGVSYIKTAETTTALGAIARFHRKKFDIPVIAITGSSGKTTTKEMLACFFSGM